MRVVLGECLARKDPSRLYHGVCSVHRALIHMHVGPEVLAVFIMECTLYIVH